MPYVYVVTDGDLHKIGYTKNLKSRISVIQSVSPKKLSLVREIEVDLAFTFESELHAIFNKRRVHHEWFNLSEDDLQILDKFVSNRISGKKLKLTAEAREHIKKNGEGFLRIRQDDWIGTYGSSDRQIHTRLVPPSKTFLGGIPIIQWWELQDGGFPVRCIQFLLKELQFATVEA